MIGRSVFIGLFISACAGGVFVVVCVVALCVSTILNTSLLGSLFSKVAV